LAATPNRALVDDDEPQVAEPDVLAEEPVRADHDVDRAVGQAGDGRDLGGRRHEPRQQPDLERERGEALRERRLVLRGQDGRRDEDRDLLAVLGRLERGPQRDLGLAVPDVADDQPVHRPARLHVGLDLFRGAQLVRRLLVRETPPSPTATARSGAYANPSAASRRTARAPRREVVDCLRTRYLVAASQCHRAAERRSVAAEYLDTG
jgi:hypothetical protein